MFARTVSATAGPATSKALGEVRPPPSSAQCLRAASTAGALLAGYFPHLRGAFQFPAHLALLPLPGDALQCSTLKGQQSTHIASVLATQVLPACKADAHLLDQTPTKDVTGTNIEVVRNKVMATLVDKEYRPRIQRLEDSCLALRASKLQFESDAQRALDQVQKTRELNRRLCRDLNEVRSERTAAIEELDRLKHELERALKQAKQTQRENTTLREALQDSQQQVVDLTLSSLKADSSNDVQAEASTVQSVLGMSLTADKECSFSSEPQAELGQHEEGGCIGDNVCRCNDNLSWGCSLHRTYSDSLLLAHRDVASRISRGPPGLEPEAPPGLEFIRAASSGQQPWGRLHMMPAC